LGGLVRRMGHFDLAEDAVQEALIEAARRWRDDGIPDKPRGWLFTVAFRRLTDQLRSAQARQRREQSVVMRDPSPHLVADAADEVADGGDDSLTLLFLCCHPSLSAASQIALTLRAVGGLTTAEIARAFFVPEATMGQRISRAKQRIREADLAFRMPTADERAERLAAVLQVLYLVFNEGHTATAGDALQRRDLADEAIRLTRMLWALLPQEREVAGLLALLLLTDSRRETRTAGDGALVPLAEQDRRRWDRGAIAEGVALVERCLGSGPVGAYQLQAAIAAVHAEAPTAEDTDWPQILALYELLVQQTDTPAVRLNRAIALTMVHGPDRGLAALEDTIERSDATGWYRFDAVRAHLLELSGDREGAVVAYEAAATGTLSQPEQRYLRMRAAAL
ncbi:MAG: sigma-70 family RNA polymerase sigma factor, partial [Trueperaceae bacterium]